MARKTRKYSEDVPFSLTSMMDMMTIILVFMIKNMDAEGQLLTQAENLILDANYVIVDNEQVVPTADVLAQEDLLVTKVDDVLKDRRAIEQEHALKMGLPADEAGHIIVQIDKNIPYDAMYKVMATCGFSGYTNVAFAVMQKNGGEE